MNYLYYGKVIWSPADRRKAFRKLTIHILELWNARERQILDLRDENGVRAFSEQLLVRQEWDRFIPEETKTFWEKKKEKVGWVKERFGFLLNSNLPNHLIRHLIAKEILEVTTIGSQLWFLRAKTVEWCTKRYIGGYGGRRTLAGLFRIQHPCIRAFQRICSELEHRYPCIKPEWVEEGGGVPNVHGPYRTHPLFPYGTLFKQLTYRYSYFLYKTYKEGHYKEWLDNALQRYKWYFEKLALEHGTYSDNKYREKFLRELSTELTGDVQRGRLQDAVFLSKKPERTPALPPEHPHLEWMVREIMGCLNETQIRLLDAVDVQNNGWRFEDQLRDRFRYRRPSMAPLSSLSGHIRFQLALYQPLINEQTADAMREILLDELEEELFVPEATRLWNQEMNRNLKWGNLDDVQQDVRWAIQETLSYIDKNAGFLPSITLNGTQYDLKSVLLARWWRAWLAGNKKHFLKHLSTLHIRTIHCPHHWKEGDMTANLQTFLREMDPLFLYPREGRKFKRTLWKDDEGRYIGWRRRFRDRWYYMSPVVILIWWAWLLTAVIITVILVISNPTPSQLSKYPWPI